MAKAKSSKATLTLHDAVLKMMRYREQNRRHKKLGVRLQALTRKQQAAAIVLEAVELDKAVKDVFAHGREAMLYEAADVMVICVDFCLREGWTEDELARAIEYKLNLRFGEEDEKE